jgi:long-chain fatty acid transport protein
MQMRPHPPTCRILTTIASLAGLASVSTAEGFRSPTLGTQGLGLTGGRRAFIDDASAVWHQPSNLTDLTQWEVAAEPTVVYYGAEYRSPLGASARTEDPWKFLPSFFAGGPLTENLSAGLGITSPYGLGIKWEENGAFRYTAPYDVSLQTINVSPTLAYKFGNGFSVAAGLDVMWGEVKLRQFIPWGLLTGVPIFPDGVVRTGGDGIGVGGNLSATWEFTPNQRFVVGLRLPMDLKFEGDLSVSAVPVAGNLNSDFATKMRFPTTVTAGYGIRFLENFTAQVDLEWVQFSRFQELPVQSSLASSPLVAQLPPSVQQLFAPLPQRWKDTFTAGASLEWRFREDWRLQGSYQYFESPVPDETFSPLIPDSNQHALSTGLGYRHGRHRVNAAYSYVIYEDRSITSNVNPAYLGDYEWNVHLMSLAYGFAF